MKDKNDETLKDKAENKLKKVVKKKIIVAGVASIPLLLFILLIFIVLYFMLNPLATLRTAKDEKDPIEQEVKVDDTTGFGWSRFWKTFGGCLFSGTCIDDEDAYVQQKIYNIAKNSVTKLQAMDEVNHKKINPYLAMATAVSGSDYNSDDDQYVNDDGTENKEAREKYFNEAKRMLEEITVPGEGLTKPVYYCIDADDESDTKVKCVTGETEAECKNVCKKETTEKGAENHYKIVKNIEPRTNDEFKKWLIEDTSSLENHLINYNVAIPTDYEARKQLLNSEADTIILRKDYYAEVYNDYQDPYLTDMKNYNPAGLVKINVTGKDIAASEAHFSSIAMFGGKYDQSSPVSTTREFLTSSGTLIKGHSATDFAMPVGTTIYAIANGYLLWKDVTWASGHTFGYVIQDSATGNYYIINTVHVGAIIATDDVIYDGQLLAYSDQTGYGTGPHTHVEIVNITNYVSSRGLGSLLEVKNKLLADGYGTPNKPIFWDDSTPSYVCNNYDSAGMCIQGSDIWID